MHDYSGCDEGHLVKSLLPAFCLVILLCAICFVSGYKAHRCQGSPAVQDVAPLASTYVFGRAVDTQGGLLAGVTVELGTQRSTTNESGQWGLELRSPVAGQTYLLYVFPLVERIASAPAGTTLQSGNVIRFTIPKTIPDQLGPFVLQMRPLEATWTPYPTDTPTVTATPTPTFWYVTHTPTRTATVTPPAPPTETATPELTPYPTRPTPWWLEGLKPGYYHAPAFVQEAVLLELYEDWGWDWDDCFYKFAAVYNLGLPCGPLMKREVCWDGGCVTVRYQLWGKGDLALIADEADPCLVGIIYNPDNGDGRWHVK